MATVSPVWSAALVLKLARFARGGGRLVELCSTRGDGNVPPLMET